jgi:hypothetical protein
MRLVLILGLISCCSRAAQAAQTRRERHLSARRPPTARVPAAELAAPAVMRLEAPGRTIQARTGQIADLNRRVLLERMPLVPKGFNLNSP